MMMYRAVLMGSISGPLGIFIEAVPDHRITRWLRDDFEMMRANRDTGAGRLEKRLQVTASYATAPETPLSVAARVLKVRKRRIMYQKRWSFVLETMICVLNTMICVFNTMICVLQMMKWEDAPHGEEVRFQWKNPDFQWNNPDFQFKNPDFVLKNVDSMIKNSHVLAEPGDE